MDSMDNCKKCGHECHCIMEHHADSQKVCECNYCECSNREEDKTYE